MANGDALAIRLKIRLLKIIVTGMGFATSSVCKRENENEVAIIKLIICSNPDAM